MLASCNAEEAMQENNREAVTFASGIVVTPQSRVSIDNNTGNSVWAQGDPIGIYMLNHGSATIAENASNVKYTAASAGTSTAFSSTGTIVYYPVSGNVDFIAYHPHSAAVANFVYPVNVGIQASQTAIDLMWAKADNSGAGYNKTNRSSAVNFTFGHQLAKLVMNVSKDASVTADLSAMTVSINGMNTTANFDLRDTGGLSAASNMQVITPCIVTAGSEYEAILLPVAALGGTHTVTFTVGTEVYTWTMADNIANGLQAGKIYTFDIVLKKHAVAVSGDITRWTVGSAGIGVAD